MVGYGGRPRHTDGERTGGSDGSGHGQRKGCALKHYCWFPVEQGTRLAPETGDESQFDGPLQTLRAPLARAVPNLNYSIALGF